MSTLGDKPWLTRDSAMRVVSHWNGVAPKFTVTRALNKEVFRNELKGENLLRTTLTHIIIYIHLVRSWTTTNRGKLLCTTDGGIEISASVGSEGSESNEGSVLCVKDVTRIIRVCHHSTT